MIKSALIIDDDPGVIKNFSRLLSEEGFDVCTVKSGKEAMNVQRSFDVILVDFCLPDINGAEVLRKISSRTTNSVKIMITGLTNEETQTKMNDIDIDAYVVKPISPLDLLQLIYNKLNIKGNF